MIGDFLKAFIYALANKVKLPDDYKAKRQQEQKTKASKISALVAIRQAEAVFDQLRKSGLSFADFKKAVKDGALDVDITKEQRDQAIRNNVQVAYNRGRWTQQQASSSITHLMYLTKGDDRVRPNHQAINRVVLPKNHPFWRTHYPPNGFNCFLPDTQIDGRLHGAIKRFYSGQVVQLVTQSGRKIGVTANHPILTSRGWVQAQFIKNGDNLLAYDRPIEGVAVNRGSGKIHDDQPIPIAENLFESFVSQALAFGEASALKLDHNLAIQNSEVHIDVTDDGLLVKLDTMRCKRFGEDGFVSGDDGALARQGVKSVGTSDGVATISDPIGSEDSVDVANRCSNNLRNLSLSDVLRSVEGEDGLLQLSIGITRSLPSGGTLSLGSTDSLFDGLPLEPFGLALSSQDDALFSELSSNGSAMDRGLFVYLVDAHASQVFGDPVVDVWQGFYSGHVYDFQSDCGLISANGIITHNCRCVVIGKTISEAKRIGITADKDIPKDSPDDGWDFNVGDTYTTGIHKALDQAASKLKSLLGDALESFVDRIKRL